jgi:hypothetical protein
MDEYGLSYEEFMEQYYFCLQYPAKKQRLQMLLSGESARLDGMPHGTNPGNPTLSAVINREPLIRDCEDIEQSAMEAWPEGYQDLLRCVALGETFAMIDPDCKRDKFSAKRRKFFYLLWKRRKNR